MGRPHTPSDANISLSGSLTTGENSNAQDEPITGFPSGPMTSYKITCVMSAFKVAADSSTGGDTYATVDLDLEYWNGSAWVSFASRGVATIFGVGTNPDDDPSGGGSGAGTYTVTVTLPGQRLVSDIQVRANAVWDIGSGGNETGSYDATGTWSVETYTPGGILIA